MGIPYTFEKVGEEKAKKNNNTDDVDRTKKFCKIPFSIHYV